MPCGRTTCSIGRYGREPGLAVVAVEDAGRGALGCEAQQRHGALGVDEVAGHDEHERRVARLVLRGQVGEGGSQRAQRREAVGELGGGEAGEGGVAEVEQGVDLAVEHGDGGEGVCGGNGAGAGGGVGGSGDVVGGVSSDGDPRCRSVPARTRTRPMVNAARRPGVPRAVQRARLACARDHPHRRRSRARHRPASAPPPAPGVDRGGGPHPAAPPSPSGRGPGSASPRAATCTRSMTPPAPRWRSCSAPG